MPCVAHSTHLVLCVVVKGGWIFSFTTLATVWSVRHRKVLGTSPTLAFPNSRLLFNIGWLAASPFMADTWSLDNSRRTPLSLLFLLWFTLFRNRLIVVWSRRHGLIPLKFGGFFFFCKAKVYFFLFLFRKFCLLAHPHKFWALLLVKLYKNLVQNKSTLNAKKVLMGFLLEC